MDQEEFRRSLIRLLSESGEAYRAYLDDGRTFRLAKMIRNRNDSLRSLLADHRDALPVVLRRDAEAILHHLDTWTASWKELEESLSPEDGDRFVFETVIPFPRDAESRIMEHLRTEQDHPSPK
jgi:hypothetical protein